MGTLDRYFCCGGITVRNTPPQAPRCVIIPIALEQICGRFLIYNCSILTPNAPSSACKSQIPYSSNVLLLAQLGDIPPILPYQCRHKATLLANGFSENQRENRNLAVLGSFHPAWHCFCFRDIRAHLKLRRLMAQISHCHKCLYWDRTVKTSPNCDTGQREWEPQVSTAAKNY